MSEPGAVSLGFEDAETIARLLLASGHRAEGRWMQYRIAQARSRAALREASERAALRTTREQLGRLP